jgi:rSAM/selenodomain-associated transferase 2
VDISVVIPVLDEAAQLAAAIASARAPAVREVIVVDGGSADATPRVAREHADLVLDAPRGRALQMNRGGAAAHGAVLLFLHADTRLPADFADAVLGALADPLVVGGRFDVRIVPATPLLRLVGGLMNLRSRLSHIATGDQAIFVRRATFAAMGGFPAIPLMEDIAFSRALRRQGRVACLRERVETSARRWLRHGPLRTVLLMWWLRLLYFFGASPARLRRSYDDSR